MITASEPLPTRGCAETRDRTGNLQTFSLTLSQLSYHGCEKPGRQLMLQSGRCEEAGCPGWHRISLQDPYAQQGRVRRRLQVQAPGGSSTGQPVSPPFGIMASGAMPGRGALKRHTEKATLRRWSAARRPCWVSPKNERAHERANERTNERSNVLPFGDGIARRRSRHFDGLGPDPSLPPSPPFPGSPVVPCGLELRTLRLLAVRFNQLSYETHVGAL